MPAFINIPGTRRLIGLTPADTVEATILTAGEERPVVVGLWVTNITGTAANATVKWGDGTNDFSIIDTFSIAANDFLNEDVLIPLRDNYTIKVTSGTGNALTFTLVVVEFGSAVAG